MEAKYVVLKMMISNELRDLWQRTWITGQNEFVTYVASPKQVIISAKQRKNIFVGTKLTGVKNELYVSAIEARRIGRADCLVQSYAEQIRAEQIRRILANRKPRNPDQIVQPMGAMGNH